MKNLFSVLIAIFYAACLFGQSADDFSVQGGFDFAMGDYDEAIESYTKAILIDPNYEIAYLYRGRSKFMLRDY